VGKISWRPFRSGDEAAINDGFNAVFGQHRTLAEWAWKFPDITARRPIMLAVDDDRIVVHYGAIPVRMEIDGRRVFAGQVVDVYSHGAGAQGLALARAYVRTVDRFIETFCGPDELALCFGFPGERTLRLGVMRTHYDQVSPGEVPVWRRENRWRGRWPTRHRLRQGFDAAAADRLWATARRRSYAAAVRDGEYLGRRYTGRPGVDYVHLVAWSGRVPAALAVLRLDGPVARWAELVWNGHDPRALAALDRGAARLARRAGCDRLEMWLSGDREAETALVALGWSRTVRSDMGRVVHVFHPALDAGAVQGRLYMTMGDSDLV
jgi:hypothetical protein